MSDTPTSSTSASAPSARAPATGAKVLAVTSGKGGVGKTFVSANLAAALTKRGYRVLVLDADLGLANLDVVLNLYPKTTLHDVFTGKAKLEATQIRCRAFCAPKHVSVSLQCWSRPIPVMIGAATTVNFATALVILP